MKRLLLLPIFLFLFHSCIPLRIAPDIEDYKVSKGKKFKRGLPKRQMFIFEDHKDAYCFYNFINTKFDLKHKNVHDDVPFEVDGKTFFFSFYEVGINSKPLTEISTLFDIAYNAALVVGGFEPIFADDDEDAVINEHWYITIEVYNDTEKDCLSMDSLSREAVLKYLHALKNEYTSTYNHNEVVFKN
ncbi:hypothetical protein [Costertonia aggregata]|uniref:Uncharacterized protein n=1 Tax=Costertonia aggregata TaxID=343403 RepID=A0A7H9AP81_9FLAO|nr:hypothetical protein [Costertonia aggregata]QLG45269.1 hypothetical protein HYG79_07880 [Costertonia aggregata]